MKKTLSLAELDVFAERVKNMGKRSYSSIFQVLESEESRILLHVSRLDDDSEEQGRWIEKPAELPDWSLDGTPFFASLREDIRDWDETGS